MDVLRKFAVLPALGLLITAAAGCGGDDPEVSVQVVSPTSGALVTVPFQVVVEASVPLGSSDDGLHHVHIWFGDDEHAYLVVESDRARINHAPNGEQVMHVSLRQPDHAAAGAETAVTITIAGGSS